MYTAAVTTVNPGSAASNTLTFTVNDTAIAAPVLTSLTPNTAFRGVPGFTLLVIGTGFVLNAVVRWNGSDRATTFVNSTSVLAEILAADVAAAGTPSVTAVNPGSAASNALAFNVATPGVVPIADDRRIRIFYRAEITGLNAAGAVTLFYYAGEGITTKPTHPRRPSQWMDARLKQPLLLRRDMYGAQGATRGAQQIPHGEIVLDNADGALDPLFQNYGFDVQPVKIYRTSTENTDVETLVFDGVCEQMLPNGDSISLTVRDGTYKFDITFQTSKYLGTGGLEGDLALTGFPKPYLSGDAWNFTPVLINSAQLLYQLSSGPLLNWSMQILDRAVPLLPGEVRTLAEMAAGPTAFVYTIAVGDRIVTSSASGWATGQRVSFRSVGGILESTILATANYYIRVYDATSFTLHPTPADAAAGTNLLIIIGSGTGVRTVAVNRTPLGAWDWCSSASGSYVRLGSQPTGRITATYTSTTNHSPVVVIPALVSARLGTHQMVSSMGPVNNENVGLYVTDEQSLYSVIQELLHSINGSIGMYPSVGGTSDYIYFYRLEIPAGTPAITLTENNVLDVPRRIQSPDPERGIPAWRINMDWSRNWTIMSPEECAGSVNPITVRAVGVEYSGRAPFETASVKIQYPASPVVNTNTNMKGLAPAALAAYFSGLYNVRRDIFVVTVPLEVVESVAGPFGATAWNTLGPTLGMCVSLTSSRFGLGAGKLFRLIGLQQNFAARTAELTLWG